MRKKAVIFLRSNSIDPDPRVEKEALSLSKNDFNVIIVGWDREGDLPSYEKKEFGEIYRIKIKAKFGTGIKNIRHLLKWQIGLTVFLVKNRNIFDFIHACDFDTIIPALICKAIYKKKVIYDIFDFYADMLRNIPNLLRRIIRKLDLFLIGLTDAVIIADESRKEQIKGSKPKRLVVIYNSPSKLESKNDFQYSSNLIIGYIGLLQKERGILEMIDVVKTCPEWKLIIGGFGGDEDEIRKLCDLSDNIKFIGRVPYEIALNIYSKSTVLFATYDPKISNHRFSSANKLFEAMMLGKPIIVAKNTGMDKIVEKYNLGFVVEYGNKQQIKDVLSELSKWGDDKKREFSNRVRMIYQKNFSWEIMEKRLIDIYRRVELG